jgi:small subunit ribosomal protein S10
MHPNRWTMQVGSCHAIWWLQGPSLDLAGVTVTGPTRRRGRDWIAQLHIRSFDHNALDYACQYVLHLSDALGVRAGNIVPLPTQRKYFTVLRSPHVYKTARDQFVWPTHKRLICIYDTSPEAFESFFKELGEKAPISVQIKCKKRSSGKLAA